MPKYSFILPVYKVENYLEECLNSILNQQYSNFEVILIDDESPDNCPKICDIYKEKDSRIKVIHQKNGGVSAARNAGLKIVKGQYILFVDPDDYIADNYLLKIDENIKKYDMLIFSYYNKFINKEISGFSDENTMNNIIAQKFMVQDNMFCGYLWNKVFNAEIIKRNSISFDESISMNEDVLFCYQYLEHSREVKIIPDRLIYYRQRKSSLISQKIKNINASTLVVTYKYILDNSKDFDTIIKCKGLYIKYYQKYKKFTNKNDFDYKLINCIMKNDFNKISKKDKRIIFMYKYFPIIRTIIYKIKDCFFKKYD